MIWDCAQPSCSKPKTPPRSTRTGYVLERAALGTATISKAGAAATPTCFYSRRHFPSRSGTGVLHTSVMRRTCRMAGTECFICVVSKEPRSFLTAWLEAAPFLTGAPHGLQTQAPNSWMGRAGKHKPACSGGAALIRLFIVSQNTSNPRWVQHSTLAVFPTGSITASYQQLLVAPQDPSQPSAAQAPAGPASQQGASGSSLTQPAGPTPASHT